ncbi:uncharacterized protein [Amphiura filiformis]|uniref:uncharacterized protein n=1 Tax=Amphiura filiformis TaxID=82378 RepID=UPI003B21CB10
MFSSTFTQGDGSHQEESKNSDSKSRLNVALKFLQACDDYSSQESLEAFETITFESVEETGREDVGDHLARNGYAELYVSVMKWVNEQKPKDNGEEGDDDFKFIGEMMGGYWNFSDGSPLLCQRFGECGVIDLLFQDLQDTNVAMMAVNQLKNNKKKHHLFAKLGILHNCIRLHADNRVIYRKANAVRLLTNFLQAPKVAVYVKTICLLIVAYIVDETESEKLASSNTGGCVNFLISLLRKALSAENQRYGGFTALELLEGINHLAMNDSNKVKTVEGGCLALMTLMMSEGRDEKEQLLAARAVWRLSFVAANKKIIQDDQALMNALEKLQTSSDQSVRRASSGALWEIHEGKVNLTSSPSEQSSKTPTADAAGTRGTTSAETDLPHVMISYQWDVQNRMIVLKNLLTSRGYKVWMDIEKMEGNILAAMANAVEKAAVILICVSRKYKDSESCRTEASYAYKKRRAMIPLMMDDGYDPDGWLGALIGVKLYFTMFSEDMVHKQLANVLQELGTRGKGNTSAEANDSADGAIVPANAPVSATAAPSSSQTTSHLYDNWSTDQFQTWLKEIGLEGLTQQLEYCDGKHMVQMYRQYQSCPEYFHSTLRADLKMDFHAVLKFTTALHQLFLKQQ